MSNLDTTYMNDDKSSFSRYDTAMYGNNTMQMALPNDRSLAMVRNYSRFSNIKSPRELIPTEWER